MGKILLEGTHFYEPKFMIIIIRLQKIRFYKYQQQEALKYSISLEDCQSDFEIDFASIKEVIGMLYF